MTGTFPRPGEDELLHRYWTEQGSPVLWLEVKIGVGGPGDWPNKKSHRRLDGLMIPGLFPGPGESALRHWGQANADLAAQVRGRPVELIEVKSHLNFDVIGQAIAGADMFSRAYPDHGLIRQVAVVGGDSDPALDWVCAKRGIDVVRYSPSSSRPD